MLFRALGEDAIDRGSGFSRGGEAQLLAFEFYLPGHSSKRICSTGVEVQNFNALML